MFPQLSMRGRTGGNRLGEAEPGELEGEVAGGDESAIGDGKDGDKKSKGRGFLGLLGGLGLGLGVGVLGLGGIGIGGLGKNPRTELGH